MVILSSLGIFILFQISSPVPTVVTPAIDALPTPTPETKNYTSTTDNFTFSYANYRQFYQDVEPSGNRYTLYSAQGNFAIHVGTNWSWIYPNRQFTSTLQISGLDTFVFDAGNQIIYDFISGDKKYTIQCIHNNLPSLQSECDKLISSFKLL